MALFYYGDTLLPEVPVLEGFPDYIIVQDKRLEGYKYRVLFTTNGFVLQYGSIVMKNQEVKTNYLLPVDGNRWVDAKSVGDSYYSYHDIGADTPFIFTNTDINDYSTDALWQAAMTPRSASHNILVYLQNATATAENPTEISETATLTFTAKNGEKLLNSVVVLGAEYTWDSATGTLALSGPTDTVRVWVGYAEQYKILLSDLIGIADAIRAKTGNTSALKPTDMADAINSIATS